MGLLLALPSIVLADLVLVQFLASLLDGRHGLVVTCASPFESGVSLGDRPLALLARALLLGFLLLAFEFLPLFFSLELLPFLLLFECRRRVALRFLVGFRVGFLLGGACFGRSSAVAFLTSGAFGSAAFSANAPSDPTGRRSTTPGAASVASTILGSSVCSAKPRLKMSGSDPQASAAAFIDGAATARSKKPMEVR